MDTGTAQHDEPWLRQKALEAIRGGRLPMRPPNRIYGGPGSGTACAICGVVITRDDMGLEIEFDRHGTPPGVDSHSIHPRCMSAWEVESRHLAESRCPAANGVTTSALDGEMPRRQAEKLG